MRIDQTYAALLNGDHINEHDLIAALEYFATLSGQLTMLGPRFALAAEEANRTAIKLNDMHKSRHRDR